jgi:hypothetical protein
MEPVVGIFPSRPAAERAAGLLEEAGVSRDRVNLLAPGGDPAQVADVPTSEAEPPGITRTIGAVAGTAAGAAGGMQIGAAVSLLIPGIGPVIALGVAGAALLGVGGAAVGAAFEHGGRSGVPRDELFFYEEALRAGKSVVVVLVDDDDAAARARGTLEAAGAESIDAARDAWWIGLRDAEAAAYAGDFARDERAYRLGFEAALGRGRGRAYAEVADELRAVHPDVWMTGAFRRGYERGSAYGGRTRRAA